MEKILRIGRGVKVRRARAKEICDQGLNGMDVDMKVELIQALIPIGLWHVKEELEEEVRSLAGEAVLGRRDGNLFGSSGGMVVCPERADPRYDPGQATVSGQTFFRPLPIEATWHSSILVRLERHLSTISSQAILGSASPVQVAI